MEKKTLVSVVWQWSVLPTWNWMVIPSLFGIVRSLFRLTVLFLIRSPRGQETRLPHWTKKELYNSPKFSKHKEDEAPPKKYYFMLLVIWTQKPPPTPKKYKRNISHSRPLVDPLHPPSHSKCWCCSRGCCCHWMAWYLQSPLGGKAPQTSRGRDKRRAPEKLGSKEVALLFLEVKNRGDGYWSIQTEKIKHGCWAHFLLSPKHQAPKTSTTSYKTFENRWYNLSNRKYVQLPFKKKLKPTNSIFNVLPSFPFFL